MNLAKFLRLPRFAGIALLIAFSAGNPSLLFGQEQQAEADISRSKSLITFFSMGDIPYNAEQDLLLIQQIEQLPRQAEFCVHVGDIKTQGAPCDELVFNKVFGMLGQSPLPMFIVPGDNKWNECDNPMLYLHGDGHVWIHDRPFAAKNILRVQVDSREKAPPVKVIVSDSATAPFTFDRGEPYKH